MALKWNIHELVLLISFLFIPSECTVESVCIEAKTIPGGIPTKDDSSETTSLCDFSGGFIRPQNISTFDSVKYEYHGNCSYTLLKSCNDGLNYPEIIGKFDGMSNTVIRELRISDPSHDDIILNGYNVSDFKDIETEYSDIACYYKDAVVVNLCHGIKIYWGDLAHIVIEVPESTQGLCGLCGNNNGIKYDDLSTKEGNLVTNIVTFGDSWRTDDDDCPVCSNCKDDTLCEINPGNAGMAENMCAVFDDADTCGDYTKETLFAECVNILCAILPDPKAQVCPLIEPYLEACADTGVDIRLHLNDLCGEGCHVDQELIPYGNSWINPDCTERYTCEEGTDFDVPETIECHEHATCIAGNGGEGASCVCSPKYNGDGFQCVAFWSDWSAWSSCSVTCGSGTKDRRRSCSVRGKCDGLSIEYSPCTLSKCPCWTSWGRWTSCNRKCGGGTTYRYRSCRGYGRCPGSSRCSRSCNTHRCFCWSVCFASSSIVRTKKSINSDEIITSKRLSDLVVGDHVESYDPATKSVTFSEVYYITHQHDNRTAELLKLVYGFEGGEEMSLSLHAKHLVYACIKQSPFDGSCKQPPSDPVTADSVSVGDDLWVRNSNNEFIPMSVLKIDYMTDSVRHPMTFNHFIVVDGALASVHMYNEWLYRQATAPLRVLYNIEPSIVDTSFVNQMVAMWDLVEMYILEGVASETCITPKNDGPLELDGSGAVCTAVSMDKIGQNMRCPSSF